MVKKSESPPPTRKTASSKPNTVKISLKRTLAIMESDEKPLDADLKSQKKIIELQELNTKNRELITEQQRRIETLEDQSNNFKRIKEEHYGKLKDKTSEVEKLTSRLAVRQAEHAENERMLKDNIAALKKVADGEKKKFDEERERLESEHAERLTQNISLRQELQKTKKDAEEKDKRRANNLRRAKTAEAQGIEYKARIVELEAQVESLEAEQDDEATFALGWKQLSDQRYQQVQDMLATWEEPGW